MYLNYVSKSSDTINLFSHFPKEKKSPLQWEVIDQFHKKLFIAHHVMISIGDYIYLHGGICDKNSNIPTNNFYKISLKTYHVENITDSNSPYLSQHAAVVYNNRYILLIGGWDGHVRTYKIYMYDSINLKWFIPFVSGFKEKTGLSGHTANLCFKNSNYPEILVIGREGSTRTQRKHGNIWKLVGNEKLNKFNYNEISIHMDSRSNHCTAIMNSKLFVVGGRSDKNIDVHMVNNLKNDNYSKLVQMLIENCSKYSLVVCPATGRKKACRRGHCLIPCMSGFAILGGQSFMSTNSLPDSGGFLCVISKSIDYYFLGYLDIIRTNGAFTTTEFGDSFYHGGIGAEGDIQSQLLKLNIIY